MYIEFSSCFLQSRFLFRRCFINGNIFNVIIYSLFSASFLSSNISYLVLIGASPMDSSSH